MAADSPTKPANQVLILLFSCVSVTLSVTGAAPAIADRNKHEDNSDCKECLGYDAIEGHGSPLVPRLGLS
jgi:hypothetical protein